LQCRMRPYVITPVAAPPSLPLVPFTHRRPPLQHMLRLGWTLLVGSTLSAAAFHATPLARSPRPALVHASGKPTAARFAPPAPRVVMTFGDTVSELFGGIAAVLAVVAITQDDGDAVESQRATEASAEATYLPALARAEQALAEAEKAEAEAKAKAEAEKAEAEAEAEQAKAELAAAEQKAREAEAREAEAKELAQAIQQAASLAATFYSEGEQSRLEAVAAAKAAGVGAEVEAAEAEARAWAEAGAKAAEEAEAQQKAFFERVEGEGGLLPAAVDLRTLTLTLTLT